MENCIEVWKVFTQCTFIDGWKASWIVVSCFVCSFFPSQWGWFCMRIAHSTTIQIYDDKKMYSFRQRQSTKIISWWKIVFHNRVLIKDDWKKLTMRFNEIFCNFSTSCISLESKYTSEKDETNVGFFLCLSICSSHSSLADDVDSRIQYNN